MSVVVLGHYSPRLPAARLIMSVERRTPHGWRGAVIAGHGSDHRTRHLTLTNRDIAHADTTLAADPIHYRYALLWQARVHQRWLGGHLHTVARVIAEHLRPPRTLAVDIDRHTATQLVPVSRPRGPGLWQLLCRLTDAGMVALDLPGLDGWGIYTLCIATVCDHSSTTAFTSTEGCAP